MSYADQHPVYSPYFSQGGGPVSIEIGGRWEEEEAVTQAPYDEQMEWDVQQDPTERHGGSNFFPDDVSGWSEMEWETTQTTRSSADQLLIPSDGCPERQVELTSFLLPAHLLQPNSSLVLCLDTNTLIRHLPLITALHTLLLEHSISSSSPPPISFLIPTVVVQELDGLKSSRKAVQSTTSSSTPSIHASTIGTLAQRANHFLLDQKRKERVEGVGRGVFFVAPPPSSATSNDDRILATAHLVRSSPSSSSHPPTVLIWTSDVNLSLKCEAEGIETMGSGSRIVPKSPLSVLQMLGVVPRESTPRPSSQPLATSATVMGAHLSKEGIEIDVEMAVVQEGQVAMAEGGKWDESSRGSFRRLLERCVPLALDRRLREIRKVNSLLLDNAGLPSDPPPRSWRLDQCFDALSRIWGNEKCRWDGRDLGLFRDRRQTNLALTTSPPSRVRSNVSIHARPSLQSEFSSLSSLAAHPPHPPSPKHVREVLLPVLVAFFSASWIAPSDEDWVDALKAAEIVLGGPGGRRFLGEKNWKEVLEGLEKGWEELAAAKRRERGIFD